MFFYIACYKISEEKFEKYLKTYKNQQKIFCNISYHQKRLLLRELAIPIRNLLFDFVFIYELYYCFTSRTTHLVRIIKMEKASYDDKFCIIKS